MPGGDGNGQELITLGHKLTHVVPQRIVPLVLFVLQLLICGGRMVHKKEGLQPYCQGGVVLRRETYLPEHIGHTMGDDLQGQAELPRHRPTRVHVCGAKVVPIGHVQLYPDWRKAFRYHQVRVVEQELPPESKNRRWSFGLCPGR